MNIRKPIFNSLICLMVVFMIGAAVRADTIRLKDGSVLKGKVVAYTQGKFTIVVYIGGTSSQHVIGIDEIDSVEFSSSSSDVTSSTRAENPGRGSGSEGTVARTPTALPIDPPQGASESANASANDLPPADAEPTGKGGSGAVIAEKTVSVGAAADWTSTEIRVQRGQRIVINANGEVDLGNNRRSGPDGLNASDNRKLIPNRPTGALIAVVSDDNDDFVFVGRSGEFTSPHNGILFLSVNEGNLKDNNGAFVAKVKVLSNK